MAGENCFTNHGNDYLIVYNFITSLKLVQLLVEDDVLKEQLAQKCKAKTSNLLYLEQQK